jgi:diguanylate cyclase (GGDEF)-like protein
MIADAARELAQVAAAWLCAGVAASMTARTRATARADRAALIAARAREAALADVARRLAGAARSSVDAVRDEIARGVRVVAPAIDGVLLFEEHDGALRCSAAFGSRFAYFAGSLIALDDSGALAARALAAGHRVTLDDEGVRKPHPTDVAAVGVPLVLDGGRSCVMVAAAQVPLDAEAVERIVALADQASPAYLIALDREHDRRRAEYDGLTGLLTPRAFRQRLVALIDRARFVPTTRVALLFVDTDRFKHWNDAYGHAAGDTLLRELARLLRGSVAYEADLVARNGGDEFCIVFTETDKATAIERAELVRARIAALDYRPLRPDGTATTVQITASIGVAAFPADAANATELLERADAAMYHAKQSGRDGVAYCARDGGFARLRTEERV